MHHHALGEDRRRGTRRGRGGLQRRAATSAVPPAGGDQLAHLRAPWLPPADFARDAAASGDQNPRPRRAPPPSRPSRCRESRARRTLRPERDDGDKTIDERRRRYGRCSRPAARSGHRTATRARSGTATSRPTATGGHYSVLRRRARRRSPCVLTATGPDVATARANTALAARPATRCGCCGCRRRSSDATQTLRWGLPARSGATSACAPHSLGGGRHTPQTRRSGRGY